VPSKFLTIEETRQTVQWARATASDRETFLKWVELDHDQVAVVKALRHPKNEKAARVTAARIFGTTTMRALCAVHLGETELDQFKTDLRRAVTGGKINHTKLQAIKLLARVNGFDASALESSLPDEGRVIGQKESVLNGRRVKTTVVDLGAADE
jgi:hypothetical protein